MNLRPPGYEPDELPTALPRDVQVIITEVVSPVNPFVCAAFVETGMPAKTEPAGIPGKIDETLAKAYDEEKYEAKGASDETSLRGI